MPRYSDELIADIFAANDIIDYVSKYVALTKRGKDYMGLCPFHSEKSPSFHVNADKQLFHCFGCGAGGNLVQFVMRSENLDFVDALRLLADNAGIQLPEEDSSYNDERHRHRQRIYDMNKLAARFFYEKLTADEKGMKALSYLTERGITGKTITVYGLGYAPDSYDALLRHLRDQGFSEKEITDASLAVSRDGKTYDKFRNRVMFPIIDVRGNIIGFGGRIFEEPEIPGGFKPPKYLNSGETAAFDKGKNLFSLNLAKKSDSKRLILVEGYMDVITVYQAGIHNIVATLGTAITENQAKLINRYASEVLICYDMDEAGRKAVLRAIDIFSKTGGKTKVVKLKGAKDPDEYIRKSGVAMFKKALDEAVPSTEFILSVIRLNHDLSETDGKIGFVSEAAAALSSVRDSIEVDAYINKISDETGIGKEAIYAEYRKHLSTPAVKGAPSSFKTVQTTGKPIRNSAEKPTAAFDAQRRLLNLIAGDKHIYNAVKDIIKPEDYSPGIMQEIAGRIYGCREKGREPDAAEIMNYFSDDEMSMSTASSVFYELSEYKNKRASALSNVKTILLEKNKIEMRKYADDINRLAELIAEKNKLEKLELTWD